MAEAPNAEELYQRGRSAMNVKDYVSAIRDLSEAIALDPNHWIAYNDRAVCKYRQGDLDGAIKDYTQQLRVSTKNNRRVDNFAIVYGNRALAYRARAKISNRKENLHMAIDNFEIASYWWPDANKIDECKRDAKDLKNDLRKEEDNKGSSRKRKYDSDPKQSCPSPRAVPHQGGYPTAAFIDKVPSNFICIVCCDVVRDPYETPCAHVFCKTCIQPYLQPPTFQCPYKFQTCESCPVSDVRPLSAVATNVLMSQDVRCVDSEEGKGCGWKGVLKNYDAHTAECGNKVSCSLCNAVCRRADFDDHSKNSCPFRPTSCPECASSILYGDVEAHELVCRKRMELCGNGCGEEVPRERLTAHMCEECKSRTIPCMFWCVGCRERIPVEKVVDHNNEQMQKHLQLMMASHAKVIQRLNALEGVRD